MSKAMTCLRGHDTSYPGSRGVNRRCRQCKRELDKQYPESKKAYEGTYGRQVSRFSQYKKRLSKRIEYKKERLRLLYEEEI